MRASTTSERRSWRNWSVPWFGASSASQPWDYVLVHSDMPLEFYSHLYALKPANATAHACLKMHTHSTLELWNSGAESDAWHVSVTGADEHGHDVEWVVRLCGSEDDARLCYRVLQNCLKRLTRLDHELQHGDSKRLYKERDVRMSPYKGQVDWLVHSDRPVIIESSPRRASRLPDEQGPTRSVLPMSPTWTAETPHGCAALLASLDLPSISPLCMALHEATDEVDYDSLSRATSPILSSPVFSLNAQQQQQQQPWPQYSPLSSPLPLQAHMLGARRMSEAMVAT